MKSRRAQVESVAASRRPAIAGAIALLLAAVIAYIPALRAGYIWDDDVYLTGNRALDGLDGLRAIWIPPFLHDREAHERGLVTPQYYPVVFTSFWIERHLYPAEGGTERAGLAPFGYHAVNVLLHALNALLLAMLARRVGASTSLAWAIAFLFALHPVHVESVAWVTERKNVLSGCFAMLAALLYLRFDRERESRGAAPPERVRSARGDTPWAWYSLATILFCLAILSKSVTAAAPVAIALLLFARGERLSFRRLSPLLPWLALGAAAGLHTGAIERVFVGAIGPEWDHSLAERLSIAARSLWFYPWKIIAPLGLTFIYPRWSIEGIDAISLAAMLGVVVVVAGAIVLWLRRGMRWPVALIALYGVAIFPAIGFANVYPHRFSFVADHFQYLASIGVVALVAAAIEQAIAGIGPAGERPRARGFAAVCAVLCLGCAGLTFAQARHYADEETLWRATIARNEQAWMAHANLARVLLNRAETSRRRSDADVIASLAAEALDHAERGLVSKPGQHTLLQKRAEALRLLGRIGESVDAMRDAIEAVEAERSALADVARAAWQVGIRDATLGEYYALLGRVLEFDGRPNEARAAYESSIALNHRLVPPLDRLAALAIARGDGDEAARRYEAILARRPTWFPALVYLGDRAREAGDHRRSLGLFARALDATTNQADREQALFRLAWLLATSRDAEVRDGQAALECAEELVRLTRQTSPYAFDALAAALAECGRFEEAARMVGEARKSAQANVLTDFDAALARREQAYREARAWRE